MVGDPIPQGSKRAGITRDGRPYVYDVSSAKLKAWRSNVHKAAAMAMAGRDPLEGAISVIFAFAMHKPRTREGELFPSTRPDWDKLARAVGDSLESAGVVADDGQISDARIIKDWADGRLGPEHPGVRVWVWPRAPEGSLL